MSVLASAFGAKLTHCAHFEFFAFWPKAILARYFTPAAVRPLAEIDEQCFVRLRSVHYELAQLPVEVVSGHRTRRLQPRVGTQGAL